VTVHCVGPATWDWSGYTDKRGEFVSFAPKGLARFDDSEYGTCRIVATLSGFQRGVTETGRTFESNVVVTLKPLVPGEGVIAYTDIAVPVAARKLFDQASGDARVGRWKAAEGKLRNALDAYPSYALAWNELGLALEKLGSQDEASNAYAKALSLDARLFSASARLAVLEAGRQRWDKVATTTEAAIGQNPVEWPSLFFYNAVASYNLGRLDEAERSAARAADLQFFRAHYILGRVLLAKGQFQRAIEEMSKYLDLMPNAADAERVRAEIRDAAARSGR
jgi:tetratricopeptide (TPR) repeat protein